MEFIYPSNLKSKPTVWLWEIKDVVVLTVASIVSVFALIQTGILIPAVLTVVYGILCIQIENISILSFIQSAFKYFIIMQQRYDWSE